MDGRHASARGGRAHRLGDRREDLGALLMSMEAMQQAAPWRSMGWKEVKRKSGTHPLQWLRGIRTIDRFDCPMHGDLLYRRAADALDHLVCLVDKKGAKLVVSHPYQEEIPDGLAEACKELRLEFEWSPPSASWYGFGTSRVVFRVDRRITALKKLGVPVTMGRGTGSERRKRRRR